MNLLCRSRATTNLSYSAGIPTVENLHAGGSSRIGNSEWHEQPVGIAVSSDEITSICKKYWGPAGKEVLIIEFRTGELSQGSFYFICIHSYQ